ncbi:preprotein translocase subunit SecE [Candidatus Saccharibacteria bacterium]|nr:preprotein translocase subunit SecE [Candidatus Saccharibacteria bacterium]
MANITKIKAEDKDSEKPKPTKVVKKSAKASKAAKPTKSKKPFLLFRPFVALGRYLKNSWKELRQVHWPTRKATWKMVLAIFVYTFLFGGFLVALDILFDFIFSKLLG